MNFLRWVNIRDDYTISWTSSKIQGRNTDGGLEWQIINHLFINMMQHWVDK